MAPENGQDIRKRLDAELRPGERLVWWEQPDPKAHARQGRGALWFGIIWCTFIAAFSVLALSPGGGVAVFFGIFLIPFWLIGFWLLAAPKRARAQAQRTIYGVTDRRAVILTTGKNLEVRSFYPHDLGKIKRVEYFDGSGDLVLRQDLESAGDGDTVLTEAGFIGIKNVRRVERLLDDVKASAA